ncbi:MAG: Gfo/Idh/MocA family protein [Candidatus Sumerlaeaceae bacterium]
MAKLGWGVIGAGGIADRRTIPEGIVPAKNAKLVAVMTPHAEKAAALGAKYGVKSYDNIKDLLADPAVQAVYIASPNDQHKAQAIAAAKAGKHVFCEKPLALNAKDAAAMLSACEKAGVKLGVGFMMRYNAAHQQIKKLIDKGGLGKIVFARAQLTCWYPQMPGAWRQDPKCGGGGAIMDLAVHCIDLLEMLLGPVAEVGGYIETRVQNYKSDDANALLLKFANGAIGFVDCAFCIPDEASENVLEIQGSKGCVKAKMTIGQGPAGDVQVCTIGKASGYSAAQQRDSGKYAAIELSKFRNTYLAEIEDFSKAVLNGTEPPISGAAGLHSMRVVEAAMKAAKTGKVQKVSA